MRFAFPPYMVDRKRSMHLKSISPLPLRVRARERGKKLVSAANTSTANSSL
jgi:hypothetical protein